MVLSLLHPSFFSGFATAFPCMQNDSQFKLKPMSHQVVILGGGYAGIHTAKNLEKYKDVEVCLVSPREGFMLNKYSALRSAVRGGAWADRTLPPVGKHTLQKTKFVYSAATGVDPATRTVTLEDGTTLQYNVLVIATGSRNFSPAEAPTGVNTVQGTKDYWQGMQNEIGQAKRICIVGTGPVGIELAGEILDAFPETKLTLVGKEANVLGNAKGVRPSGVQSVEKLLTSSRVDLRLSETVESHSLPEDMSSASPVVNTPEGVTLGSGAHVDCDLLIWAIGGSPNVGFVPSEWMAKGNREVNTDPHTLLVNGTTNVFAVGDVAHTNSTKLGYLATQDGSVVAENVKAVLEGKEPKKTIGRSMMLMLVPFGENKGRLLLPFFTLGNSVASWIKGKDLFTLRIWKDMENPASTFPKL